MKSNRFILRAALAAVGIATSAHASVVDATWLGSTSTWNNAAAWNVGVVPNNGANTYNAVVPGGAVSKSGALVAIDSLTIGAAGAVSVLGGTFQVGGAGLLGGAGTLTIGGSINTGTFNTSASTLTIDDGMHVVIAQGTLGSNAAALVNRGAIFGNGSGAGGMGGLPARLRFSSIQNLGTIEARSGVLEFNGTYTRDDLGSLAWSPSGAFRLGGTIENQSRIFNIASGQRFELNGMLTGGTVNIDSAGSLSTGSYAGVQILGAARLDGVTVNGAVYCPSSLGVSNLLGNATYNLANANLDTTPRIGSTGTVSIASTVRIRGAGGFSSTLGSAAGVVSDVAIVNHGTLSADNTPFAENGSNAGEFDLATPALINDGTLAVKAKNFFYATGDVNFQPGGTLDIAMTSEADVGLLRVAGTLDLTTIGDSLLLASNPNVSAGTYYRIATTGAGVLGTFDSVSPGFEVMYTSNEIFARVVPETTTLGGALSMGIVALLRSRGRRRT